MRPITAGSQRTAIYVVGRFDEKAVRAAIDESFSGWTRGPAPQMPVQTAASGAHFAFVDQPGAAQSNVIYGIAVPDVASPDATQLTVMNSLLGGSFGSRITSNIREQKGYTYSPRSSLSQGYETNVWTENAAITTVSTGPAIQEIVKEIKRLQDAPPTAAELGGIQRYEDGVFVLRNSSRGGILNNLSFVDFHHLSDDYLTGYVQRVDAVTPDQVQAMAKKYLNTDAMSLVVVGDPTIVKPQPLSGFAAAAKWSVPVGFIGPELENGIDLVANGLTYSSSRSDLSMPRQVDYNRLTGHFLESEGYRKE